MDTIKPSPFQSGKIEAPRFSVPAIDTARMERRRNDRLRDLMDQMARAKGNQNDADAPANPSMPTGLNRNALLAKDDLVMLQAVNDEFVNGQDRRGAERKSAAHAGDDLPLFNPLKKDISI